MLSLSEAAKAAGVSKSTIWRACKGGRLSFTRIDTGDLKIDPAEIHRVFPFHATGQNGKKNCHATEAAQGETVLLETQITMLKDITALLRDQLDETRKDRDAWKDQAGANQRLLEASQPRRKVFGWSR